MTTVPYGSKIALGFCLLAMSWQAVLAKPSATAFPLREIELPAKGASQQHHLSHTADGRLIVSWVETDGVSSTVRFVIRGKKSWSPVQTVLSVAGKLADPPVVLGLSDESLAVAWMPYKADRTDKYAADIYLARSLDGGSTWSAPLKPYGGVARIYDAQMSLAALPAGRLALVWTDMRFASHDPKQDKKANRYQLMATVIDSNWQASPEMILDNDVCSCCRVYTDAQGERLVSVYRDHDAGEIRDITAVRWNPQAEIHTTPVHKDFWHIEGCPSNGPSVNIVKDKVAVAWFSAADGKGRVKVGFSEDGGAHFDVPVDVDHNANGYANALLLEDGSALVSWRGRAGAEEELKVAQVSPDGDVSRETILYRGGFPKWPSKYLGMERLGNNVFIAWTDLAQKKVRLAAIKLKPKAVNP